MPDFFSSRHGVRDALWSKPPRLATEARKFWFTLPVDQPLSPTANRFAISHSYQQTRASSTAFRPKGEETAKWKGSSSG